MESMQGPPPSAARAACGTKKGPGFSARPPDIRKRRLPYERSVGRDDPGAPFRNSLDGDEQLAGLDDAARSHTSRACVGPQGADFPVSRGGSESRPRSAGNGGSLRSQEGGGKAAG